MCIRLFVIILISIFAQQVNAYITVDEYEKLVKISKETDKNYINIFNQGIFEILHNMEINGQQRYVCLPNIYYSENESVYSDIILMAWKEGLPSYVFKIDGRQAIPKNEIPAIDVIYTGLERLYPCKE